MKKYQIIEIKWLDSLHTSGWFEESEVKTSKDDMIQTTVGYFLVEDKQSIIIVQSYQEKTEKKSVDAIMEIPKKTIIKIRELN